MFEVRPGLAARLWCESKMLHTRAERSGVISDIMHGRATRQAYALLLRNLWPAYGAIEAALTRHADAPGVRLVARPETYRATAIASDLRTIAGENWQDIALLPAATRYVEAVHLAAENGGARLVAHAYTRYLGDLSGGQIMHKLLVRTLGLGPEELRFYRFDGIADMAAFKVRYRAWLDDAGREIDAAEGSSQAVAEEAAVAFQMNMDLSEAVAAFAARPL